MSGAAHPGALPELDRDLVAAIAWCRIGGARLGRPEDDRAFHRAEALGLLAHDPIWRATEQGEGVLVALSLLAGAPAPERTEVCVLWATCPSYPTPMFIGAWPASLQEYLPDEHQRRWNDVSAFEMLADPEPWTYTLDATAELDRPRAPLEVPEAVA